MVCARNVFKIYIYGILDMGQYLICTLSLFCDLESYHRFYWLLDTQFSVWEVRILSKEPPQKTKYWSKQDLVGPSFEDRPIFEVRSSQVCQRGF